MDDLENATKALGNAKQLDPAHADPPQYKPLSQAYALRAADFYNKKKTTEALENYQYALYYNPENVFALYNLGGLYIMNGNIEKAKELWTKTLELQPDHADAKKWLDEISKSKIKI